MSGVYQSGTFHRVSFTLRASTLAYNNEMSTTTTFTLLGTGSSGGVPRIGNNWGACDPANPRNRRRRCSMLVEHKSPEGTTTALIDAGPDMREQLLSSDVAFLDAVLLTHSHADHIFGIDDLRQLWVTHKSPVNVYMDEQTAAMVMKAFGYAFHTPEGSTYPPFCSEHRLSPYTSIKITGAGGTIDTTAFTVNHGDIHALGYHFENLAYMPDVKSVTDPKSLELLTNIDALIIDALRLNPHPSHMALDETLAFIEQVQPRRAILTNMHTDLDYAQLAAKLPANIEPGYDGMQITLSL